MVSPDLQTSLQFVVVHVILLCMKQHCALSWSADGLLETRSVYRGCRDSFSPCQPLQTKARQPVPADTGRLRRAFLPSGMGARCRPRAFKVGIGRGLAARCAYASTLAGSSKCCAMQPSACPQRSPGMAGRLSPAACF